MSAQKINDLQLKALEIFGEEDSTVNSMKVIKHIPHQFEWKVLDPDEELTIKQKKKSIKQRAGDIELKKPPILLKDGDHIGVLIDGSTVDDLQTDADAEAADNFRIRKAEQAKEKEAEKKSKRYINDNASIRIQFDEDEEERAL